MPSTSISPSTSPRCSACLFRIGGDFTDLPGDLRDALPILSKCEKLDDQGDGLRAFFGIVVGLPAVSAETSS